ncbi:efflux RND transporter periplasmic adaptor subunit [Aliikangiella sp. IMCC44359]|uniref:efflux RND transporter periplasmic adaptor subunit n=1 Tax=Aliikangiella sp. IMCC44359 TaxID=3459125 RepID=UPI00403A8EDE
MDIPDNTRKYKVKLKVIFTLVGVCAFFAIGLISWVEYLPSVNSNTLWLDKVKKGSMDIDVHGRGKVGFSHERFLASSVDGVIEQILVSPGQLVEKGQALIKMSNPQLLDLLYESELELAEHEKLMLEKEATAKEEENEQRLKIKLLNVDLVVQKNELNAINELYQAGVVSQLDFKKADAQLSRLKVKLTIEQEQLNNRSAINIQKKKNRKLVFDKLKMKVESNKRKVNSLMIKSDMAGMLINLDESIKPGQHISAGHRAGIVSDISAPIATLKLPYYNSGKVSPGMNAVIDISGAEFVGKVIRVEPQISNNEMSVEVGFDGEQPKNLSYNMGVEGRIVIKSLKNIFFINKPVGVKPYTKQVVYKLNVETNRLKKVVVQFGQESSKNIVVNGGLNENDVVVLSNMSKYSEFDEVELM